MSFRGHSFRKHDQIQSRQVFYLLGRHRSISRVDVQHFILTNPPSIVLPPITKKRISFLRNSFHRTQSFTLIEVQFVTLSLINWTEEKNMYFLHEVRQALDREGIFVVFSGNYNPKTFINTLHSELLNQGGSLSMFLIELVMLFGNTKTKYKADVMQCDAYFLVKITVHANDNGLMTNLRSFCNAIDSSPQIMYFKSLYNSLIKTHKPT